MKLILWLLLFTVTISISGCYSFLPYQGPTKGRIHSESLESKHFEIEKFITLVELDPITASKIQRERLAIPSDFFVEKYVPRLGVGDVIEILIQEQPPSVLFSSSERVTTFSTGHHIIDIDGTIELPIIGKVEAKGKTVAELASDIRNLLKGKANNPNVTVRQVANDSSYVTVFGSVRESRKIPLSQNVSTILDVLAHAGGVTSPVEKTVIQIDRRGRRISLPLNEIITKPELNLNLMPKDRITVVFKNQSATVLGAIGKNEEIEFEAKGISLNQLIARAGGLNPNLANAQGVFVFRLEDFEIAKSLKIQNKVNIEEGVPIIYSFDLTKPETFFTAKNFIIKNGDIVYVATAPSVQFQQFLNILSNTISPIFMIERMTNK